VPASPKRVTTPSRTPRPALRFPCGHVEPRRSVSRRMRVGATAAWVACRHCNLITVAPRA
jgi:hypothetical protein